uniref:Uncharacterized protein n=1 Tax=Nothoprocta perdicaria TaxID=30464 RepID=A0A8C6Z4V2_NOTPE
MGPAFRRIPLRREVHHWPKASRAHELVERPILPTCITVPLQWDEYPMPSGWGPQQDTPSALARLLKHSHTHSVPATGDITSSKRKTSGMRKIGGDTRAPQEEATELLGRAEP